MDRRSRFPGSPLLVALVLLGPAKAGAQTPPSGGPIERVLAAADESSAALSAEMTELGREAIPAAFAALARSAPSASAPARREALLAALLHAPPQELRAFFDRTCLRGVDPGELALVFDVIGAAGSAGDLASLARWASGAAPSPRDAAASPGEVVFFPAVVDASFSACVGALLARDPRGHALLPELMKGIPPALRPALVRGVASARTETGMRLLAAWADADPDLRITAIVQIGRMAGGLARPIDAAVRASVRRCAADPACAARPEAILAAGELDDDDAIPCLIELLRNPSPGLRADALWSLEHLSGLHLRESPERWAAWYASEETWWRVDAPRVLANLGSGSAKEVHAALQEIAGIRTQRDRLALAVAAHLDSKHGEIVAETCVVLARLGSTSAVPALTALLASKDEAVRNRAREALKAITGSDAPPDSKAWSGATPGASQGILHGTGDPR